MAALRGARARSDWKPRICWQVPLFFDTDDETPDHHGARVADCRSWGRKGNIDWWCTERHDAFSADQALYVTMEAELRRVCGDAVYDELAAYCKSRQTGELTEV